MSIFFVARDGQTTGPFSLEEVHARFSRGEIDAGDWGWCKDVADWMPMGHFLATFPLPLENKALVVEWPKPAAGPSSLSTGAETEISRYPILRVMPKWFWTEVLAIYDTHLLLGRSRHRLPALTEQVFDPGDDSYLSGVLKSVRRVQFVEIARIQERFSGVTAAHKFIMRGRGGELWRFAVPAGQAGSLQAVFSERFPDCYWRLNGSGLGLGGLVITLLLGLGAAGISIALLSDEVSLFALVWALLAVVLFILTFRQYRRLPKWGQVRAAAGGVGPAPAQAKSDVQKRRQPARSLWLGWLLKFLGVAYWLAMAGPLTDELDEAFMDSQGVRRNFQVEQMLLPLLWVPAPFLIYSGYRLSLRSYESRSRGETRKPIVYLRPFEDDEATTLQPSGIIALLAGVRSQFQSFALRSTPVSGRFSKMDLFSINHPVQLLRMVFNYGVVSSEESIVRYFETYGPVIAVGRPGEGLATPGAERVYLADDQWQDSIAGELRRAQAIVVQPGLSDGVRWELDHLRRHVEPFRVLLCLVSFWNNPQAYELLIPLVRQTLGVTLPRVLPFLDGPAFIYFDSGWGPHIQPLSYRYPALWPLTGDATDLRYSLHPFVQGMHGGDREPPRSPRWEKGIGKWVACAGALILGLALMLGSYGLAGALAGSLPGLHTAKTKATESNVDRAGQIPRLVTASPKVKLNGNAVSYQCEVPEALLMEAPKEALIEHWRKSPDGRLDIQIVAHNQYEDISGFAGQRLEALKKAGFTGAKLELARTKQIEGVDWVQVRLSVLFKNGVQWTESSYGTSSRMGTVIVVESLVRSPDSDDAYLQVEEDVMKSFRFPHSAKN